MEKLGAFAKGRKCPCCNNPWQLAQHEGDGSVGSAATPTSADALDSNEFVQVCAPCMTSNEVKGIDPANFDNTVRPQDDFYLYSNGGWKQANPCPAAFPRWGVFNHLNELNQERLKVMLEELESGSVAEAKDPELIDDIKKLCDFHKACMNEKAINEEGINPLLPLLQLASTVNPSNMVDIIAELHRCGVNVLFNCSSINDKDNAGHTMAAFSQSGLGLPDRDYYFDVDKLDKRDKYQRFIEDTLIQMGQEKQQGDGDGDDSAATVLPTYKTLKQVRLAAQQIFQFETAMAQTHYTKTELRDVDRTFNKTTLRELNERVMSASKTTGKNDSWGFYLTRGLQQQCDSFDFIAYMNANGMDEDQVGIINVRTYEPLLAMASMLRTAALDGTLAAYFQYHIMLEYSEHASATYVNLHFEFFKKTLTGAKELKERWKRALDYQQNVLGEAMGKLYVKKYFNVECKRKALAIVEEVRDALRTRLGEVSWMCDETRVGALAKMEKFRVKIGYPEKWINYSALPITANSHLTNMLNFAKFERKEELARINKPTDRDRWFMPPQMVNAYYHPMLNEIVFPAAILQPPFFDSEADDAVQFGGLGCVVGHEMTHGFDDKGRKFDKDGAVCDWWAGDDGKEYEKRASVMINQASQHDVFGTKLKGELTQGENIADLGGVTLALRALNNRLAKVGPTPLLNGFNPHQRFFLAWSQVWRQNCTKEHALAMVTLDPHGPSELRCNNTLSNVQEFFDAFNVNEKDPMYRAVKDRVDIW